MRFPESSLEIAALQISTNPRTILLKGVGGAVSLYPCQTSQKLSQVSTVRDHLSLRYFPSAKERLKHASNTSRFLKHCPGDLLLSHFTQSEVGRESAKFESLGADENNEKGQLPFSSQGSARLGKGV